MYQNNNIQLMSCYRPSTAKVDVHAPQVPPQVQSENQYIAFSVSNLCLQNSLAESLLHCRGPQLP